MHTGQNYEHEHIRLILKTLKRIVELARAVEEAIDKEVTGLYHLTNNQKINKFELLKLFRKYFNLSYINSVEDIVAQYDKSIKSARIGWDFQVKSYAKMVNAMCKWMLEHPELYTQYKLARALYKCLNPLF
ncbi:MAG: hypothetical protein RR090_06580 [Niameybacter sp.]|uniref:hypothetical protein n=1 Tax=Niameybacter sp. TaxID=2033640 RepID=UPI002FCA7535